MHSAARSIDASSCAEGLKVKSPGSTDRAQPIIPIDGCSIRGFAAPPRSIGPVYAAFLLAVVIVSVCLTTNLTRAGDDPPTSQTVVAEPTPTGIHRFSDGVWIDWGHREVALEARVVLRKGPLELLACSPRTREHESILVVNGRPRDIYHAMGLLGLEPGSPVKFDPVKNHLRPATGESLRLRVEFERGGVVRTVPASAWLRRPSSAKSVGNMDWVFAGSHSLSDGRFSGDVEGTIVTLVDFESALIATGALHTSDNEALWLEAQTDAIPPVGTCCRLIISSALHRLVVAIASDGSIKLDGRVANAEEIVRRVREMIAEGRAVKVLLQPMLKTPDEAVLAVVSRLVMAGLSRKSIQVQTEDGERSRGFAPRSPDQPE